MDNIDETNIDRKRTTRTPNINTPPPVVPVCATVVRYLRIKVCKKKNYSLYRICISWALNPCVLPGISSPLSQAHAPVTTLATGSCTGYNCDSTAMRPPFDSHSTKYWPLYDCSTTQVTTVRRYRNSLIIITFWPTSTKPVGTKALRKCSQTAAATGRVDSLAVRLPISCIIIKFIRSFLQEKFVRA